MLTGLVGPELCAQIESDMAPYVPHVATADDNAKRLGSLLARSPASHDLGVALSEEGLRRVEAPVLLQEYIAHHGGTTRRNEDWGGDRMEKFAPEVEDGELGVRRLTPA